ncbi:AbrB family transcriptional regulator, stage V sporulation protein T [Thalassobacillus cyri]|uniref:AbrB family transcriptional regulator, stage V sporulation protein T n=1 Tax=Thalassobacillus cyri TaxID=571932 RepID=A0A1H4BY40_9BACI|nr:AbrB/MazE/SpoVT family DNA-binding domain-containing protein [Thalassobacillus cyri]SEA52994.1 AbrB family transcriptional regulator, stage V sporulation protein T [Thalassobacillus cyri]
MKATGIVRKIDELGRIVIPSEIRRSNGWAPGQPMEMFIEDEKVILQPFDNKEDNHLMVKELNKLLNNTDESEMKKKIIDVISYVQQ